ncbi:MAG: hypothetical protein V1647_01390 [Pseudomonadota bacterium]
MSSLKLFGIFALISAAILVLVFKFMAGTINYYHKRDINLVGYDPVVRDVETISRKFKPIFHDVDIIPVGKKLLVKTRFMKIKHEILVE